MSIPETGPLVVVTGMTGAGRSTAAKELEDLGYFVVDNLPPSLLRDVVRLVDESRGPQQPIAVVVDVRSGSFFDDLQENLAHGATGRRAHRLVRLQRFGGPRPRGRFDYQEGPRDEPRHYSHC